MNIIQLLNDAEGRLKAADIDTARLDAEVLLAYALGVEKFKLYTNSKIDLTQEAVDQFLSYIDRRAKDCPVAYITGVKEFWSIPIKVTQDVLIPRPETELIVERSLEIFKDKSATLDILDLCTGSGCIAAALAIEFPNARFVLTDVSASAIDIARINLNFASNRSTFYCSDLFDSVPKNLKFDLITANPPYIPTGHRPMLGREITDYEPEVSLFGGKTGLDFISKIIENAALFLKPDGWFVSEMGLGQADKLEIIADQFGGYKNFSASRDLAGIERVISLQRKI